MPEAASSLRRPSRRLEARAVLGLRSPSARGPLNAPAVDSLVGRRRGLEKLARKRRPVGEGRAAAATRTSSVVSVKNERTPKSAQRPTNASDGATQRGVDAGSRRRTRLSSADDSGLSAPAPAARTAGSTGPRLCEAAKQRPHAARNRLYASSRRPMLDGHAAEEEVHADRVPKHINADVRDHSGLAELLPERFFSSGGLLFRRSSPRW